MLRAARSVRSVGQAAVSGRVLLAFVAVGALLAPIAQAQIGGGGQATASPAAGSPFPWEAGQRVSTWGTVNLYNGNLINKIPLISWTSRGRVVDFALYHNSASAEGGMPVAPACGHNIGGGWTMTFAAQLYFEDADTIWVIEDDGLMLNSPTSAACGRRPRVFSTR